jgi:MoaA/NifB/PqqE/SkfB family radical SAM enzyme
MRLIRHPVLCNYYVTYRCNATCSFCDIWEKPSPYVTLDNVRQNLKDLKRLGVKVIDFTGGEPLLHRELHLLLKEAKQLGFITTVTSNGLLYPSRSQDLKGLIDMLHFSLDAADAATHNAMRGVACFEKVMESIAIAKQLGERPDILFTVFSENIAQIEKVYREITQPNGLMLILNPAFNYNDVEAGSQLNAIQRKELKRWAKTKGVYLNEAFLSLRENGGNHILDPICKAASSTIVISPENELVVPCYHLGQKTWPINNQLESLWKSAEVQKAVSLEGRLPECEGCTINCYMQPSFAVEINAYFWQALPSTLKYSLYKGTWKKLFG